MTKPSRWQSKFEALKAHVAETEHFPNKHTKLNTWCRYQRKRMKAGLMPEEQRGQLKKLTTSRDMKQKQI